MKKKNFLTTGEFARLCKTTKETLFHYDRENLLKPRHVSGNGYRYYGMEQFFDFDMIAMLKDTGSSLKEIRAHIHNTDAGDFLSLLEEKRRTVKKERARLAQRETMLRDMSCQVREALNLAYDAFGVQEQKEEHLEIVATKGTAQDSVIDFVERFVEYIDFYEKQGRKPRSPFGVILDWTDIEKAHYFERYYFCQATRSTPRSLLHVKPAGNYAVLAHKGTVKTHMKAIETFLQKIEAAGLTAAGNCYCYDMMSYVLLGSGNMYAAKYCVRAG
ncbi:MerR family transcriptional regulator [Desulfosarcina sp. OttesenSCG-928-A07]|nr:MerR family transcriptional regulator [Desulfosarcina sp. OttesenSCG-928-G17]MDL2328248.1 MerR family transcriptional regulator [Desulfosarcina sp. OttesenSCG-928-A07]